ncbi:DUF2306 domain-containing protein [Salinispora mooreana]|uniref:DUF2306 domain-containing protein n=1 Tax=Salinispora mooreana TaxID=999545 RepID=UPI0003673B01|nr:DUF2306 domain-containing protein [Salinispora mooreana]
MPASPKREWLVPAGLIALSAIPAIAGAFRVTELTSDTAVTPDNARFFAAPTPVLVHIVSSTLYCLFGALQFARGFRRRRPDWHRSAGRLLVPLGLTSALSGLWMTIFYDRPAQDNELLTGIRLVAGATMIGCLILGVTSIRQRKITRHRAWMARAYAIGLGAGTQALTNAPWILLTGESTGNPRALLMLAGWLINVAVVEWALGRRPRQPRRAAGGRIPTNVGRRTVPANGQQERPVINDRSTARLG